MAVWCMGVAVLLARAVDESSERSGCMVASWHCGGADSNENGRCVKETMGTKHMAA